MCLCVRVHREVKQYMKFETKLSQPNVHYYTVMCKMKKYFVLKLIPIVCMLHLEQIHSAPHSNRNWLFFVIFNTYFNGSRSLVYDDYKNLFRFHLTLHSLYQLQIKCTMELVLDLWTNIQNRIWNNGNGFCCFNGLHAFHSNLYYWIRNKFP